MFDLKHINKDEMDKRMKKIEESRHIRMSRCYTNINKKYNGYNNYNNYNNNYNNNAQNGNNQRVKQVCTYCNGTGKVCHLKTVPTYGSTSKVLHRCSNCNQLLSVGSVHIQVRCPHCNGTGYR